MRLWVFGTWGLNLRVSSYIKCYSSYSYCNMYWEIKRFLVKYNLFSLASVPSELICVNHKETEQWPLRCLLLLVTVVLLR